MSGTHTSTVWERPACPLGEGLGERASIGLVSLARDRVAIADTEAFYRDLDGVTVFSTRMPSPEVITPESLLAMRSDLATAAGILVPGSRLDVLGFCCTSGTAAIGVDGVASALREGRGDLPVTTPISAAVKAIRAVGARRIALLVPYWEAAATIVAGFFEAQGIEITRRATFDLAGDASMNRVSEEAISSAASSILTDEADALFVSCTAIRTAHLIERLEQQIARPVLTSNQVMAWDCLRTAGVSDKVSGHGRLFRL